MKKFDISKGLGLSLGCFTLSYSITSALLHLFQKELHLKNVKMDSDPFIWMPTILDEETYVDSMQKKDYPRHLAKNHYQRMQKFKAKFTAAHPEFGFFGAVDIGEESYWWDYGTLENYYTNIMKLTAHSVESEAMRKFFNIHFNGNSSCLLNCYIKSGTVKNSVLVGVEADHLDVSNCLIINTKIKKLTANECLLYNVQEQDSLNLEEGTVRADTFVKGEHLKLYTSLGRDGKADWNVCLPGNTISYQELYALKKNEHFHQGRSSD